MTAPSAAPPVGAAPPAATAASRVPSVLRRLIRPWRRSLRFRTVAATLLLSALAILIAGVWMAAAIQNDLFQSRTDQALVDSRRAALAAQTALDSADLQGGASQVRTLLNGVQTILAQQSATDMIAVFRADDTDVAAPPGFFSGGLREGMISDDLRVHVQTGEAPQWWQSVALEGGAGPSRAGILVGQQLVVPQAGTYELYLAYDLDSAAQTLQFVQLVLWLIGGALVLLIGGIIWFVLRSVTAPIAQAAQTSARLADGELDVRISASGEDELAVLARSYNAMADSIERQIGELAELSLVQQRFVSDVSHELRTPLTTIRLAADVLNDRRDAFDAETARAAELLFAQVARFEVLLGDLLEISRYDAGSVQLEREPTSLAHLAGDVIASMEQLAVQRGSEVRLLAPGGYGSVDMDPRRIRRIVRNVLGNAIEHGEGRPIVVTVDSDPDAVAVGIRDHGLGMTEEESARMFDRFWRADPSRRRTIGGTGLGMSIALGDATLHGGTLSVWSAPGRGTNVVLTLPRRESGFFRSPVAVDPADAPADDEQLPDAVAEEER